MQNRKKRKVCILLAAVMVIATVTEAAFAHPHYHRLWNLLPGADILIGISGAVIFIFMTKGVMYKWLHRPEAYYKEDER